MPAEVISKLVEHGVLGVLLVAALWWLLRALTQLDDVRRAHALQLTAIHEAHALKLAEEREQRLAEVKAESDARLADARASTEAMVAMQRECLSLAGRLVDATEMTVQRGRARGGAE